MTFEEAVLGSLVPGSWRCNVKNLRFLSTSYQSWISDT